MLVAIALLTACASEDTQQKNDTKQGGEHIAATFTGHQPKANGSAKSRTTATYTIGNAAQVLWESTDHIYVEDDGGTFRQSFDATFPISGNNARANFQLATGPYSFTRINPRVLYTGFYGGVTEADIARIQTQDSPNDFSHLGKSGDCGSSVAKGGGGDYEFILDHKASYLCFLPRCMNTDLGPNIKLTKIVVKADKNIAGRYDFTDGSLTGKTPISGASNTITLNLGGTNGFSLNTTTANLAMNGAYMVIAPGTYNLTISYTLQDVNGVSGEITKTLDNFICPEGQIKDITANLTPPPFSLPKYYLWDAQQHYWKDYESEQPTINRYAPGASQGIHYPQNNSDPQHRWYNESYSGPGFRNDAQTSLFTTLPNVNELYWYVSKGDARWDSSKITSYVGVSSGHLRVFNVIGGLWLKKRSAILTYLKNVEHYPTMLTWDDLKEAYWDSPTAPHVDYRITYPSPFFKSTISNRPINTDDYFFIPALGRQFEGWMDSLFTYGYCWSSSANPWDKNSALCLGFYDGRVGVYSYGREFGFLAQVFE